ncbi:hypothetical protein, partial [uncultured Gammaproteobacteria bacterium]
AITGIGTSLPTNKITIFGHTLDRLMTILKTKNSSTDLHLKSRYYLNVLKFSGLKLGHYLKNIYQS